MPREFWGDLPTWVTTVAVLFAAVQYFGERARRREEAEREARAQATQFTVWAVSTPEKPRRYGVRVLNTSGSTFHDVHIKATMHTKKARRPIDMTIVPPGDFFVDFAGNEEEYTWHFPRDVGEIAGTLRPYMKTDDYRVHEVRFRDNVGVEWSTDDRAVLTSARSSGDRGTEPRPVQEG